MTPERGDVDVLVLADVNPDLILATPDASITFGQVETLVPSAGLVVGGSGTIFATGAARLGMRTAVAGMVGKDPFGDFMTARLCELGVDTGGLVRSSEVNTGVSVILDRRDDRAILTHLGAIELFTAELVSRSLLSHVRHVHVASYFLQTGLQTGLPALLGDFRRTGGTVSLDTNWDPAEAWDSGIDDLLEQVDVLLPNEAEATALARVETLDEALSVLNARGPWVVVKRGALGAAGVVEGKPVSVSGLEVPITDTTGAGDSFDAALVMAFLRRVHPLDAMRFAAVCGSLSTRARGGTAAQPTVEEAVGHISEWSDPDSARKLTTAP